MGAVGRLSYGYGEHIDSEAVIQSGYLFVRQLRMVGCGSVRQLGRWTVDQWGSWADVLWLSGAVEYWAVDQWGGWAGVLWISETVGQVDCGSVGQLGRCAVAQWGS
jgi:hypothetical protein